MSQIAAFALALARPDAPRLPSSLAARALAAAAAALVLAVVTYVGARETSVFAVREIEVAGAPPRVADEVREVALGTVGTSLVGLDGDELERRLVKLPSVRAAESDRAFPSTLRIAVRAERPLAVVRLGARAWLVSDDGRVIREVEPPMLRRLPRIRAEGLARVAPGAKLVDHRIRLTLRALAAVPPRFPLRVLSAGTVGEEVIVVLAAGVEVRLGAPDDFELKLEAAKRVLEAVPAPRRRAVAYVDVSLPARPVVAEKSLNL